MLEHGGHLLAAAKNHPIPIEQWIDLSTGINPNGWPVPVIPAECWQRLPETRDDLVKAAKQYYQCRSILPVAGSQAAIQTLPLLRQKSMVGVLTLAYAEHAYSWKKLGHQVVELDQNAIEKRLPELDVLILINPNNPTGQQFSKKQLLNWHQQLNQRNGWLIIDEAFIDTSSEQSLSCYPATDGLIILRSIGKFFGLAGIRCGFVLAIDSLLDALNEHLGPWTISHPSRYVATAALLDRNWQQQARGELKQQSNRLANVLIKHHLSPTGQTDLFLWIKTEQACQIYTLLLQEGILTRFFQKPASLRFGLPGNEQEWTGLQKCLSKVTCNK